MSDTKKKLSASISLTIIFSAAVVVFLILSIVSAEYSVSRTIDSINAIGEVEFSEASKGKIDLALSNYDALDRNIGLPGKITNIQLLADAKNEYVRLGIKRAYLADKEGQPEETVKQYISEARAGFDEYCSTGECKNISNFDDLISLEAKYSSGGNATESASAQDKSGGEEEIELC